MTVVGFTPDEQPSVVGFTPDAPTVVGFTPDGGTRHEFVGKRVVGGLPGEKVNFTEPTAMERIASTAISAGVGLAGIGIGGTLGLAGDVATAPARMAATAAGTLLGGGSVGEAYGAAGREAIRLPMTQNANAASEDAKRTIKAAVGIRPGAMTDVGDAAAELAGTLVAPVPEIGAVRKVQALTSKNVIAFYEKKIAAATDAATKTALETEMRQTAGSLAEKAPTVARDLTALTEKQFGRTAVDEAAQKATGEAPVAPTNGQMFRGVGDAGGGTNPNDARFGPGTYYADNENVAKIFAENRTNGRIESAVIAAKRPFDATSVEKSDPASMESLRKILLDRHGITPERLDYLMNDKPGPDAFTNVAREIATKTGEKGGAWSGAGALNSDLREAGFDSIRNVVRDSPDFPSHTEVVLLDAQKATGRAGAPVSRPLKEVWADYQQARKDVATTHDRIFGKLAADTEGAVTPQEAASSDFRKWYRDQEVKAGRISPTKTISEADMNAAYRTAQDEWKVSIDRQNALAKELDTTAAAEDAAKKAAAVPPTAPPPEPPQGGAPTPAGGPNARADSEAYIKEMLAKREAARGEQTIGQKLIALKNDAKAKLIDFTAPIEDVLYNATKKEGITVKPSEDIHNQIDRVLRAPSIAGQFVRDNGLDAVIRDAPDLGSLDQYLVARRTIDLEGRGIQQPSRDVARDASILATHGEYEPFAKKIDDYTAAMRKYWVDSGLGTQERVDAMVKQDPHWVPLQRVFGETEKLGSGQGTGGGVASLSKQTFVRNMEGGSLRPEESPFDSLLTTTNDLIRQGEKNKAAAILVSYKDLPGNPFQLSPLRTAENVTRRGDILGELHDLGIEQRKAWRQTRTAAKVIERNDSVLGNRLKGIQSRLEASQKESDALWAEARIRTEDLPPIPTIERILDKGVTRERRIHEIQGQLQDVSLNSKQTKKIADTQGMVDELKRLVDERKIDVGALREELKGIRDVPKAPADATISVLRNGITETWKTTPEAAAAAKALDVQQLGLLGKIFAAPVRLAKAGITGVNIPFLASNIIRDQATGIINANRVLGTAAIFNPRNFVRAAMEATNHGDLWAEMGREGATGTSFDMARNAARETVQSIRSHRSATARLGYMARHPGEVFRAFEDVLARGEELTRIQHYSGTKQALLKEGMSEAEAKIAAARASRQNTVDFARRGQWGKVMNATMLYMNPNIQGTRTLLRGFQNNPVATGTKIAATVGFPLLVATAWNLSDPQRRAAYDDIAKYEKDNNIIIMPPVPTKDARGRWNAIKIPLPQEVNNLVGLVRHTTEQAMGADPIKAQDFFDAIVGTISPATSMGGLMSNVTPQIIRPGLEVGANKNFFTRREIVPSGMGNRPSEFQVRPDTSGTARAIARPIDVSPMKVEHFVRATAGGVGSQVLNASDRVLAATGRIPKAQIGGEDPMEAIWRRFFKASGGERARRQRGR